MLEYIVEFIYNSKSHRSKTQTFNSKGLREGGKLSDKKVHLKKKKKNLNGPLNVHFFHIL